MPIPMIVETGLHAVADLVFGVIPQPEPSRQALQNCKIISHRGAHDNRRVRENTIAAFDRVHQAGVWGIELDVRWTRDNYAVVHHDENTRRVFGVDADINDLTQQELKARLPEIPSLDEVVQRYGGQMHLMVELKPGDDRDGDIRSEHLRRVFAGLAARDDFHFISLHPSMFELVGFVDRQALLLVAEFNFKRFSRSAIDGGLAGLSGQYLLISKKIIRRHHRQNQKIGTGFTCSKNCFYRELNREVDWVFTNHALKLRAIQQRLLRNS